MATKILLVDDDPDQLELRSLILAQAGHEVSTAASVPAALNLFRVSAPRVVIMDLRLPRTEDGQRLIRELRKEPRATRILLVSGSPEALVRLPEARMVDRSLCKPVRSQHLLKLIEEIA